MLKHSRISVVVFWTDKHQAIGAIHRLRELRLFDLLTRIIAGKIQIANIDQLSFHAFAFLNFQETNSATFSLARPLRTVPRMTEMNSGRVFIGI